MLDKIKVSKETREGMRDCCLIVQAEVANFDRGTPKEFYLDTLKIMRQLIEEHTEVTHF